MMTLGDVRGVKKTEKLHGQRGEPGKEEISGLVERLMAKTWKTNFNRRKNWKEMSR